MRDDDAPRAGDRAGAFAQEKQGSERRSARLRRARSIPASSGRSTLGRQASAKRRMIARWRMPPDKSRADRTRRRRWGLGIGATSLTSAPAATGGGGIGRLTTRVVAPGIRPSHESGRRMEKTGSEPRAAVLLEQRSSRLAREIDTTGPWREATKSRSRPPTAAIGPPRLPVAASARAIEAHSEAAPEVTASARAGFRRTAPASSPPRDRGSTPVERARIGARPPKMKVPRVSSRDHRARRLVRLARRRDERAPLRISYPYVWRAFVRHWHERESLWVRGQPAQQRVRLRRAHASGQ